MISGVPPMVLFGGWVSVSFVFLFWLMVIPFKDCGFSIWPRFHALKDDLQHLVLSISEDCGVQGGDSDPLLPWLCLIELKRSSLYSERAQTYTVQVFSRR